MSSRNEKTLARADFYVKVRRRLKQRKLIFIHRLHCIPANNEIR